MTIKTLGVSKNASAEEVQRAFRRLAKQYHPDTATDGRGNPDKFRKIRASYQRIRSGKAQSKHRRNGDNKSHRHDYVLHKEVVCPKCNGRCSRFVIFSCKRCLNTGKVIMATPPRGRRLCPAYNGSTVFRDKIGGFMETRCNICNGSGLSPIPKERENPCPSCRGFGWNAHWDELLSVMSGYLINNCASCRGTGPRAPKTTPCVSQR